MIEYSLAPEYRFPTAVNDAWKILEWTNDHISNYQDDPTQIYVIGDSAGGGLAAIVGRDYTTKSSSKITGTILIYPWVDQHQNYPSHEKFGKGYGLTNEYLQFFTNCYKNNDDDLKNPDFSPIFAPNLTKHAKTLIFLASHDPLRDAGLVYAKKLQEHNIPTKIKTYQPTIHGFMQYYSVLPRGKEIIQDFMNTIKVWIKR